MLTLLKAQLNAMLKTAALIEKSESTLPHPERLKNLITFLTNMESSIQAQIKVLYEELDNFKDDIKPN